MLHRLVAHTNLQGQPAPARRLAPLVAEFLAAESIVRVPADLAFDVPALVDRVAAQGRHWAVRAYATGPTALHVRVWFGRRRLDVWAETPEEMAQMVRQRVPDERATRVENAPLGPLSMDKTDTETQDTLRRRAQKREWWHEWRSTAPAAHRRRRR